MNSEDKIKRVKELLFKKREFHQIKQKDKWVTKEQGNTLLRYAKDNLNKGFEHIFFYVLYYFIFFHKEARFCEMSKSSEISNATKGLVMATVPGTAVPIATYELGKAIIRKAVC